MKLHATINGAEHEIELNRKDENVEISIDGELGIYEVSEPESGVYLIKTAEGVFEAFVDPEDREGQVQVTVGEEEFEVGIFDPRRLRGAGLAAGVGDGTVEIKSAMPGKVVRIMVETGEQISAGQGVLVVEAMKMQNELKSSKDGIVKEVRVSEDDRVNSGDVLAIIE